MEFKMKTLPSSLIPCIGIIFAKPSTHIAYTEKKNKRKKNIHNFLISGTKWRVILATKQPTRFILNTFLFSSFYVAAAFCVVCCAFFTSFEPFLTLTYRCEMSICRRKYGKHQKQQNKNNSNSGSISITLSTIQPLRAKKKLHRNKL